MDCNLWFLTAHQSLIGKANVTIGDNPPGIGTASGDLWWESDTAKGHIYYDDGSSAQWVEFNPSSGGGGGGGGGSYGDADVDSHLMLVVLPQVKSLVGMVLIMLG